MLDLDQKTIKVVPIWFDEHPNAMRLKDKDLMKELLSYKTDIDAMASFFRKIENYIVARNIQPDLPERPTLGDARLAPTPKAKVQQPD